MTAKELIIKQLNDEIRRKMEIRDADLYHDGSIAALQSLKKSFEDCSNKTVKIKELVEELIPGYIEIINEERENLKKEIMAKVYDDEEDGEQEEISVTKPVLN